MSKPKILIIEDDLALRQLYEKRFQFADFDVLIASDGEVGMQLALSELPDIVLLDILLPKMGGLGVLRNLKTQPHTKDIPIVVMTAYDVDTYRLEAQPYCDKFFLKSDLRPMDFVREINDLLEQKKKQLDGLEK